jgi:tRNA(Ile)-lysidine synthase
VTDTAPGEVWSDDALRHLALTHDFGDAPARIGVAVSGGSDSTALLHLFARAYPDRIFAVTVDHGLRPESAAEAAGVAALCETLGVPHITLRWQGPKPTGNLMDQARIARRDLIAGWANANGLTHILLGHTADDQAESFLMNLGRAAGLDGLSGMRPDWHDLGLRWQRPCLGVPRADLRAYLGRQGLGWIDDPSNDNDRFARVRARKALRGLAPLGITVPRLAESIRHLAASQDALREVAAQTVERITTVEAGAVRLPQAELDVLSPDIRRRVLRGIAGWMTGAAYPPRETQMARLDAALRDGRPATLAGLRFGVTAGLITATREPRALQGPVAFGQVWDHRWWITGPDDGGLEVRALGGEGLALCPDWRSFGPRAALVASPAVWSGDDLVAAPLAGKCGPYRAELTQGLAQFILSH